MQNLNQKILATFSISKKPVYVKGVAMTNLISSIVAIDNSYELNFHHFTKRLEFLKAKKTFVFNIIPYGESKDYMLNDNYISYLPISKENPYYLGQTIPFKDFFLKGFIDNILFEKKEKFNNEPKIKDSLFIFNSVPFSFIALK
jgi:hypothetical protein